MHQLPLLSAVILIALIYQPLHCNNQYFMELVSQENCYYKTQASKRIKIITDVTRTACVKVTRLAAIAAISPIQAQWQVLLSGY